MVIVHGVVKNLDYIVQACKEEEVIFAMIVNIRLGCHINALMKNKKMNVIELNKDNMNDLEEGYMIRIIVNGRKCAILGENFFRTLPVHVLLPK